MISILFAVLTWAFVQ